MQMMKKVTVNWCEMHYYEAEIEIPDNLSHEDELYWVVGNKHKWDEGIAPYEICTDWDSFIWLRR